MKRKQLAGAVLSAVIAFSALATASVSFAEPVSGLDDGLVLYSSFDGGNAADESGSGHGGTVVGGIQFAEGVNGGKAVLIEGQNVAASDDKQADRYIDYGTGIVPGTGDFTVSLWFKSTGESTNSAILSNKNYKSGANNGVAVGVFGNGVNFNTADGSTRCEITAGSSSLLAGTKDGEWHHLVMVADRDGSLTGYVDGEKAGEQAMSAVAGADFETGLPLVLGASGTYCNGADNAMADELRVYDRALSASEVTALYELDKPVTDLSAGLELYVPFEGSAEDKSGSGRDGTVTGTVTYADGVLGQGVVLSNPDTAGSGSAAAENYISFGKELNELMGESNFTVSFWMKTEENGANNGTILSNKDYASGSNIGFAVGNFNNASDTDIRVNFSAKSGSRIENKGISANDDAWHHVLTTFDRSGNMVTYLDGTAVKTTSMSAHSGQTCDTGLPLILGADGNARYAMDGCTVDELRVYSRALSADEAAALYAEEGASVEIGRMCDTVKAMRANAAFPQESIDAMAETLEDYRAAIAADPSAAAATLAAAKAEYEEFLDGETPLASFHLVSDVHINGEAERVENYKLALEDMATVMPDTNIAFVNAGDFTSNSTEAQYKSFYETTAEYNPVSDEKTLILLGNHDVRGPNSADWVKDPSEEASYWATAKSLYQQYNAAYMPEEAQDTLYYAKELGGYTFIMLNTEYGLKDAMYMSEEQLAWLEDTLRTCYEEDPDKPVFIISHQPLNNTHWMSNILDGFDGWSNASGTGPTGAPQSYCTGMDEKVKEVLAKYPTAVFLSGHIHNQLDVAELQMREYGALLDLPSFAEPCIGIDDVGTGYEVVIYENEVIFRARNFVTGTWMPEYDKVIELPSVSVAYQQARAALENSSSYTADSLEAVQAAVDEAEPLLTRCYDQEGLAWNNTDTPDEFYYHQDSLDAISEVRTKLLDALDGLEERAQSAEVKSAQDIYLQAGSQIDMTTSEYSGGTAYNEKVLKVKIADDHRNPVGDEPSLLDPNQSYTRKTLISFPLDGLDGFDTYTLKLYMTQAADRDFTTASVRVLSESSWDDDTVTWNTAPEAGEVAGTISAANISSDLVCTVDVTQAVRDAIEAGEDRIAFQILNDEEANSNLLSFHSSRSDEQDKVPVLVGEMDDGSGEDTSKEEDPRFTQLRENWRDYLLGGDGTGLDMTNSGVKAYVDNLNETANEYYADLIKSDVSGRTDLFDDLELCPEADYIGKFSQTPYYDYTSNLGVTFQRLRTIAYAWATEGCDMYRDDAVKAEIFSALDHLTATYYTGKYSGKSGGNWYQWVITNPTALMNICMVMYDDMTASQLERYVNVCKWYVPDCTAQGPHSNDPAMTGGNLLLKAAATAQVGILGQDETLLENVWGGVKTVLTYNDASQFYTKDADGFYQDGSYIQHQALAYIGGYGSDLYNNLGIFLIVFNGSEWEIAYDDGCEQVAYDTVFEGIEPFMYDTHMMDMVSSRDVTRPSSSDLTRMASIMNSIINLSGTFPTEEENERFDSMVKYFVGLQPEFYYENMSNITSIMKAAEILADDSITPRSEYAITKVFTMDKAVHLTSDFGLAISMHSDRTYGHELINSEGKRTWNTSDGMLYLYDEDDRQYADGYWATVDPTRLPGTTAEHADMGEGTGDRTKNLYSWTGGATLSDDGLAAIGTHFATLGKAGSSARTGTDVKKSYLIFGDKIVALGAGITSETGNSVETIVENRKIALDGSNRLAVDGVAQDLPILTGVSGETDPNKGTTVTAEYITLAGENGSQIGYYFPGTAAVQIMKETRTGQWSDQGAYSGEATNTYATIFFDHGTNPTDASYAYILMPGATDASMAAYAADPSIEILCNDENAAAARDSETGATAVNFWEAGTAAGITSDAPASVVFTERDGVVTLSVADPTQQGDTVTITLPYTAGSILSRDENVTVSATSPFTVITVNVAGKEGGSSVVSFEATPAPEDEISGVAGAEIRIDVPLGTAFKNAGLPSTVTVLTAGGEEYEASVTWQRGGFDKNTVGAYEITGVITPPDGIANSANVTAKAVLNVVRPQTPALEDTNVRDGSYADSTATEGGTQNNNDRGTIAVKQDATSYLRYGYIKLDLSGADPSAEHFYLTMQSTGVPGSSYERTDLYVVDSDWSGAALTYNTRPARVSDTPAASVTKAQLTQSTVMTVDVTQAVRDALAAGQTTLSFELVNVGGGSDSGLYIYSLESTTAGVQKPALSWDFAAETEVLDTRNAEMLLETVAGLDRAAYANLDGDALDRAAAELQFLVDDPDTTAAELAKAESALSGILLDLRFAPTPKPGA